MAKWESGKRMTIEKKSNGKLMLCNSAPPILGGIHDHFLCKWQQGFQKLPLPNEHTWCEKIGHNAWSHWVSWFQETVEKLSKRNWQHFIYGEIKNIKMKNKGKRTLGLEEPGGRPGERREDRRGYKGQCWMETFDSLWPPLKATAKIRKRCPQVPLCVLWLSRCLSR